MKTLSVVMFFLLLSPGISSAKDGICSCTYKVIIEDEAKKYTAKARRPVICESCEERCQTLKERIKEEHNAQDLSLIKFVCK